MGHEWGGFSKIPSLSKVEIWSVLSLPTVEVPSVLSLPTLEVSKTQGDSPPWQPGLQCLSLKGHVWCPTLDKWYGVSFGTLWQMWKGKHTCVDKFPHNCGHPSSAKHSGSMSHSCSQPNERSTQHTHQHTSTTLIGTYTGVTWNYEPTRALQAPSEDGTHICSRCSSLGVRRLTRRGEENFSPYTCIYRM